MKAIRTDFNIFDTLGEEAKRDHNLKYPFVVVIDIESFFSPISHANGEAFFDCLQLEEMPEEEPLVEVLLEPHMELSSDNYALLYREEGLAPEHYPLMSLA